MTTVIDVVPVSVAKPGLAQDIRASKVVWQRELIRFAQDKTRIVSALVQPVLFPRLRPISPLPYLASSIPG